MKKIIFFIITFILYTTIYSSTVMAVPATDSAQQAENRQEQIEQLKDRVATRVAEMRQLMRRAWSGKIKSISESNIIFYTKLGDKTVITDDQTIFIEVGAGGRKKINFNNLKVDQQITVFGLYDEEKGQLTAKVIIVRVLPMNINGKVLEVSSTNGTLTVQTPNQSSYIVDIETATKIRVWDKEKGIQQSGLSKITVGDRVHINGTVPSKVTETNQLTAIRILVLPGKALGIVGSPKPLVNTSPSPSASVSPSTKASPVSSPSGSPVSSPKSTP
ncbi:MAG: DUF5666 domain-containing protein [Candidatus Gottesmanbacteria bacterium]